MDVSEAIRSRRSIRAFTDKPISRGQVEARIEAGRCAPSAGNLQARDFFVVNSSEMREGLASAALGQGFIAQAPVVIVVCSNLDRIKPYGARGKELYCLQDAAASAQNMLLTAHSLGLASCWVGAFDESRVHSLLRLPGHLRPVAILPFGHAAERGKDRPRRSDDVHWLD
jgi:nitroreductase